MDKPEHLSASELAFIGDAVHTLYVREYVLETNKNLKGLHRTCSHFCSARYQAKVFDYIYDLADEQAQDILRRGRNYDAKSKAKNASCEQYSKATGLECLIGYLYLKGKKEELDKLLQFSVKEDLC